MPLQEGAGRGVETLRSQAEAGGHEFIRNELNCRVCYHEIRVLWNGMLKASSLPRHEAPQKERVENHVQGREG